MSEERKRQPDEDITTKQMKGEKPDAQKASEQCSSEQCSSEQSSSEQCSSEQSSSEQCGSNQEAGEGILPEQEASDEESAQEAASAESDAETESEKAKKKKDPKDVLIEELQDKTKRQLAEFDNFRRRTEKEKSAMFEIGAKSIIEKILPVVDNFERGIGTISDEEKATPFADGMDKVYRQLVKALEDMGVKPIEAVGKEFNPDYHNAVMHVEDETVGESIIVEELQKGYTYRDSVVRHSMVKVAN